MSKDIIKTDPADPTIELAAQRIAYWDPRFDDLVWRGDPVEPNWTAPAPNGTRSCSPPASRKRS